MACVKQYQSDIHINYVLSRSMQYLDKFIERQWPSDLAIHDHQQDQQVDKSTVLFSV